MSSKNWKEYNDQLVRRGEALMDFDFLRGWGVEIEGMNKGKIGKPYKYPKSFIQFMAFLYVALNIPYRQLEGFIKVMMKLNSDLKKPDHATIHRRVMKLNPNLGDSLKKSNKPITIADKAAKTPICSRSSPREKIEEIAATVPRVAVDAEADFATRKSQPAKKPTKFDTSPLAYS